MGVNAFRTGGALGTCPSLDQRTAIGFTAGVMASLLSAKWYRYYVQQLFKSGSGNKTFLVGFNMWCKHKYSCTIKHWLTFTLAAAQFNQAAIVQHCWHTTSLNRRLFHTDPIHNAETWEKMKLKNPPKKFLLGRFVNILMEKNLETRSPPLKCSVSYPFIWQFYSFFFCVSDLHICFLHQ